MQFADILSIISIIVSSVALYVSIRRTRLDRPKIIIKKEFGYSRAVFFRQPEGDIRVRKIKGEYVVSIDLEISNNSLVPVTINNIYVLNGKETIKARADRTYILYDKPTNGNKDKTFSARINQRGSSACLPLIINANGFVNKCFNFYLDKDEKGIKGNLKIKLFIDTSYKKYKYKVNLVNCLDKEAFVEGSFPGLD